MSNVHTIISLSLPLILCIKLLQVGRPSARLSWADAVHLFSSSRPWITSTTKTPTRWWLKWRAFQDCHWIRGNSPSQDSPTRSLYLWTPEVKMEPWAHPTFCDFFVGIHHTTSQKFPCKKLWSYLEPIGSYNWLKVPKYINVPYHQYKIVFTTINNKSSSLTAWNMCT